MVSLDDRAGNVVTTAGVFVVAATILYLARGAFLVLLLSLLFAYLLEPAVAFLEHHSLMGRKNRTLALAQVYLIGAVVLGGLGYEFGPRLAAQARSLNATVLKILESFSSGTAVAGLGGGHGFTKQEWIRDQVARHHDFVAHLLEGGAASVPHVAASSIWLFAIPILAAFLLNDGRQMAETMIEAAEKRRRTIRGNRNSHTNHSQSFLAMFASSRGIATQWLFRVDVFSSS